MVGGKYLRSCFTVKVNWKNRAILTTMTLFCADVALHGVSIPNVEFLWILHTPHGVEWRETLCLWPWSYSWIWWRFVFHSSSLYALDCILYCFMLTVSLPSVLSWPLNSIRPTVDRLFVSDERCEFDPNSPPLPQPWSRATSKDSNVVPDKSFFENEFNDDDDNNDNGISRSTSRMASVDSLRVPIENSIMNWRKPKNQPMNLIHPSAPHPRNDWDECLPMKSLKMNLIALTKKEPRTTTMMMMMTRILQVYSCPCTST